jgi:hypothetical protein
MQTALRNMPGFKLQKQHPPLENASGTENFLEIHVLLSETPATLLLLRAESCLVKNEIPTAHHLHI